MKPSSPAQYFHIRLRGIAPPHMCGMCPHAKDKAEGACTCALLRRTVEMRKPECTGTDWKRSLGLLS